MPTFSSIKRHARESLGGSWGKAILILLLGAGVSGLLYALQVSATDLLVPPLDPSLFENADVSEYFFIELLNWRPMNAVIILVFSLLGILLQSPLALGITYWYLSLSGRQPAPLTEVFRNFETGRRFLRVVRLEINLFLRWLGWSLAFFAVPFTMYFFSFGALLRADSAGTRGDAAMATAGLMVSAVLLLLASLFYSAVMNRYFLAGYLLCEDDSRSVREAIKTSVAYTKGQRFRILGFQLSFLPWFILSGLLFLLPAFYVWPYYSAANAGYARCLIDLRRPGPSPEATQEFQIESL